MSFESVNSTDNEYVEASIVRVTLTNFMRFESTEFRPEPSLCMLIDQSHGERTALYSAIVLGLGGDNSEISYYVKCGSAQAEIEIEVQAAAENLTIRRRIDRAANISLWAINGEPATRGEIMSRAGVLNIQEGNLYQFLSQERVREFMERSAEEDDTEESEEEEELLLRGCQSTTPEIGLRTDVTIYPNTNSVQQPSVPYPDPKYTDLR
ncbi:5465_t:CDS:2 [Paraglomus brasilianum]|uniref:Structural maintenance of chromosomes protein 5 n=1 Tax=Paraglomus brasilianum TaxID=144538 RepID=A0A9N8VHJ3_9GLOM|nr:5465_t:CDS:2 [Paraglomus brasilianum]